ncbi:MAG: Cyclic di-GMP phosphodiesterase response regulator RpfG [Dehalococcoides mccartyi]|nr:Cyclic di-GMP phosphodiesterase response regulator RpfG [Dehalococcoides mccartyi]
MLHKADKLSVDEYNHIKTHTIIAGNILASAEKFKPIISIIRHHHERFDGQGYPDGLKGEAIPEGSRILAIADTYDAMTSDRPYRKALSCEEAAEEIKKNLGSQFCPEFGNLFLDLFYSGTIC